MKDGLSLIAVVMDRSGSMSSCREQTIDGFNEFLRQQKAADGEAVVYYTQFDNEYEIVHNYKPVNDMPFLDHGSYIPRGSTALMDAVGRTIIKVGADLAAKAEDERPSVVIFVIQTDGYENASQEFTRQRIRDLISEHRDLWKWQFLFLGASEESMREGAAMGVSRDTSLNYVGASSKNAFAAAASNVSHARSTGQTRSYTQVERDEATEVQ